MDSAFADSTGKQISSKRILAFAGFVIATLFSIANAVWGTDMDTYGFLAFSSSCAGFSLGERFAK